MVEGLSQRQIAERLHISRNTVKKYCEGNNVPWERKEYVRASSVVNNDVQQFIATCLQEDADEGIKKQQHTAKHIYDRLVDECGFSGSESAIRRAVRSIKQKQPEAFVPLEFMPGEAMQIDWGQAYIYCGGAKRNINLFCARLCSSCAPIVFAYERQNEEGFLDALVKTFEYFGGVPQRVIFDNAKVAVKEGFGVYASKQDAYAALEAHYGFEAVFCNIASGNEKGLVEGLVGWSRRNILVPLPRVESLMELNTLLSNRCEKYLSHSIRGKSASVGELLKTEKKRLMPLPGYKFETAKCRNTRVDSYSTVRFDTNNYSVPVKFCGCEVSVKGYADRVSVFCKGEIIAEHDRCYGKKQSIYSLSHYLPLLERKGRAIFQARPVRDTLPEEFLEWLKKSALDHHQLMDILYRCVDEGWEQVWKERSITHKVEAPIIHDMVVVEAVDLRSYDLLCSRMAGVS
jgi:transposase